MNPKPQKQVSPKVTAIVILTVLVAIQIWWWKGLIVKDEPIRGGGGGGGGSGAPAMVAIVGRKDVMVSTIAGDPASGDVDGPGYRSRLDGPLGLAIDAQGNLYVADSRNHKIKQVSPTGRVTTIAGDGTPGQKDGAALQAQFNTPSGVAVSADGTIFVADTGNSSLRIIKNGQVSTPAPGKQNLLLSVSSPPLYAVGAEGVYRIDAGGQASLLWKGAGILTGVQPVEKTLLTVAIPQEGAIITLNGATVTQTLKHIPIELQGNVAEQKDYSINHPLLLTPASGGWFVIDSGHSAVLFVAGGGAEVVAGKVQGKERFAGWADGDGHVATFGKLGGMVADRRGNLYVSDTSNNCIRKLVLPRDLGGRGVNP
jgi:hypothetical protein